MRWRGWGWKFKDDSYWCELSKEVLPTCTFSIDLMSTKLLSFRKPTKATSNARLIWCLGYCTSLNSVVLILCSSFSCFLILKTQPNILFQRSCHQNFDDTILSVETVGSQSNSIHIKMSCKDCWSNKQSIIKVSITRCHILLCHDSWPILIFCCFEC